MSCKIFPSDIQFPHFIRKQMCVVNWLYVLFHSVAPKDYTSKIEKILQDQKKANKVSINIFASLTPASDLAWVYGSLP